MIKELFQKGIATQLQRGNDLEKLKVNTLRGGSTGMVNEQGEVIGTCAAQAYLRMKGINGKPVDAAKELMFAGGRLNEDHWLSVLKESYDGPILCEEDISTCWKTDQGIPVTGRPDIVLCTNTTPDDPKAIASGDTFVKPACGIELKQVMSVNSGYNVLIKKTPQLKHLMQAAHYMWQLDCPFELWYTNRNNLDMPSWMEFREFPKPVMNSNSPIGYRYYRYGDVNPKTGRPKKHQLTEDEYFSGRFTKTFAQASKITPFVVGFKLQLMDGQLYIQDTDDPSNPWVPTIVKIADIVRFYNFVGDLGQYGKVPPEVKNLTCTGDKVAWKFSTYSDFGDLDAGFHVGRNLEQWIEKIKDSLK